MAQTRGMTPGTHVWEGLGQSPSGGETQDSLLPWEQREGMRVVLMKQD